MKLFNLIDIGERAGSGIPKIFSAWEAQGWDEPVITESFNPDRTVLSLPFEKTSDKKQATKRSNKRIGERQKAEVIEYLTDHASAKTAEIATLLGVSLPRAREVLTNLIVEDIVVAEGANRNRTYRLKA